MDSLLAALKEFKLPVIFVAGTDYYWSPAQKIIAYRENDNTNEGHWALIHEVAHALLGHDAYHNDFELVLMEVAAWKKAQQISQQLNIEINKDHIEDCLDTYRDWLHERSTCPTCRTVCMQTQNSTKYFCHNCYTSWHVSSSRFCRPYRMRGRQETLASKNKSERTQTKFS
ncbi:MAG: hypothetical protein NVS1B7_3000 [Candidatus Saccharimonadales bacterium]